MQTDVSYLRAVIAVHDYRSAQRAAEVHGVSQPAISYSIRLLEADLGVPLFSRLRSGMVPTPAGLTVAVCARRVLSELSKLVDDVRSAGGAPMGLVRIGGLPYSRTAILPHAIRTALAANPGLSVRTVEGPIESLMTALHCDDVDAVICAYPDRALLEGISVEPIARDPLGFFVCRGHPLAARKGLRLEDIADCAFILPPAGSITRYLLEDVFVDAGCGVPTGRAETSSYSLIRNLLPGSDYIAFRSIREFLIQNPDDRIVALDMAVPAPTREICVLQRRGIRPTAAMQVFLDTVREVAVRQEPDSSRT